MEYEFVNFQSEYVNYEGNKDLIQSSLLKNVSNNQRTNELTLIYNEFCNLDVKMRLAFGISEIRLNNRFVSDKQEELKYCHLLYYKLADLWFAYETYIKFFKLVVESNKDKITWLDANVHSSYAISNQISNALSLVNTEFTTTYDDSLKKKELEDYLNYCFEQATHTQKTRLTIIIGKIAQTSFNLTHTDILTIIYAIRNNFVHNGESTVVPDNFDYKNKGKLLKILYPYLCLILLKSINLTCKRI